MCSQDFSLNRLGGCVFRSTSMVRPVLCEANYNYSTNSETGFNKSFVLHFHRPLCLPDPFCPTLTLLSQNHEVEGTNPMLRWSGAEGVV